MSNIKISSQLAQHLHIHLVLKRVHTQWKRPKHPAQIVFPEKLMISWYWFDVCTPNRIMLRVFKFELYRHVNHIDRKEWETANKTCMQFLCPNIIKFEHQISLEILTWPWRNSALTLPSPSRIAKSVSNNAPFRSPNFNLHA